LLGKSLRYVNCFRWYPVRASPWRLRTEGFGRVEFAEFSVKSAYGLLRGEEAEDCSRMFNFFWRIKAFHSTHVTALEGD